MSLGTLSFEIDADASGVDEATSEVEDRLAAIEEQLGATTEAAEEASEKLSDIGSKMNLGMAIKGAKMAAKAFQELAGFVLESAKAAADSGSGPMKKFVGNIDALHHAFQRVGAQAASQLAPVLQQITDSFLNSTTAAHGLKEAGNFIANVFRVVATVGVALVATFDAVGTAIAGVASMIVDVLSGNMQGAAEAWKALGEEIDKTMTVAGERVAAIWQQGQDFTGKISGAAPKKPTGLTGEEKVQVAADVRAKEIIDIEAASDARRAEIDAIGDTEKQLAIATQGFKDANEAIASYEQAAKEGAAERERAVQLEIQGKFYEAEQAKARAAAFDEAAQKATGAIDAFADQLKNDVNTVSGAMAAFGGSVLQAIPRLNDLVSAAAQGAEVGGIWGALIAAFIELASQTDAFEDILAIVDADLDQLVSLLNPIVSAFKSLMDALDPITNSLTNLIGGVLAPIAGLLEALGPILGAIADILSVVLTSMNQFGIVLDSLKPVFTILKLIGTLLKIIAPILQLIMIPLELMGRLFQGLFDLLDPVFKEIDKAISWLANRIAEFASWVSTLGERIENFVKGKGFKSKAELEGKPASTPESRAQSQRNEGLISEVDRNTTALAENTQAQDDLAKAADEATEALTNVPAGYKVVQTRFASMAGEVPAMAAGGIVTKPLLAMVGEGGPEAIIPLDMLGGLGGGGGGAGGFNVLIQNLTIAASDPASFWKDLRRTIQRESFIRTGASVATAPQWVGG